LVGSLVLDRFLIERRIGSGGFGTVYEAWDGRLERPVAVKAIDSGGAETCARVLREAQAAARLNHPGIVTLYEMGEEDGSALLVTELVDGATLDQLSREGELSDREIGEIGADLCEALDHAHSRAVVHRDIKPQNVLVTEHGEPRAKLMDFGVARLTDAAALTAPGDVVGTLAYMAPEQAEGREAGPEADVYSLALVLYECWSGENPHRRATPAATARAIGTRARPLRRLRPDLPRELGDSLDACLQARPSQRLTLEELGETIEGSLDRLAEAPSRRGHHPHVARLTVAASAAVLGVLLAAGHGVGLP
jgi:serine/threonine protein kinase